MPNPRARRAGRPGPRRHTRRDLLVLGVLLGLPLLLDLALIWGPTLASVGLSFTTWDGVGDLRWAGLKNYDALFTSYPQFWPAVRHNLLWLLFLGLLAAPFGLLLAVLIDRGVRFSRFYQSALYLPVVLSLAVVGVITVIESLRAFDLVYAVNKGRNGLELLSVLVTDNIIGEAGRIGFGSAIAVVLLLISLGCIVTYLVQELRGEERR
ncbi:carbohydrate ABC transporter permease [Streptomyces angustmyceticus]|uniref:carbohydrate ABC transporter permease n=1 Tax=Streptomyces angustmyceticus TaxID=285578 RepID=UPI0021AF5B98|nr:hypothetical protein [Streptomyces angustmyceticus]